MARLSLDSYEGASKESVELVEVANNYLTDNKGSDLELTDEQAEEFIKELMLTDKYAVSNNDLAALQVASFVDLRSEVRQNTTQIREEVRAVGSLVAACHADTIDKLNTLQKGIAAVSQNVIALGQNIEDVSMHLLQLQNEFTAYVLKDQYANNMQMAKQDLISLNQQLESDFGHNKELRRAAVGILQANDLNVHADTMLNLAEELMITTPNYWLAPALVALANWIDASRAVSEGQSTTASDVRNSIASIENMLKESYTRERAKTALFFGLISRRANNIPEANAWFREYIDFQDPRAVDHTCMVLLNLYAGGLMGHGYEEEMIWATMSDWLNMLMEDTNGAYEKTLIDDWKNKCIILVERFDGSSGSYRTLRAFSPTWDALEQEMSSSSIHHKLRSFLEEAMSDKDFAEEDTALIDSMIADLVSEYDADELPIRREQEYQQLIVDLGGRRTLADKLRTFKDDILTESKSFVSIISDAARDKNLSHASSATRALALRIQIPWITRAYEDFTANYRAQLPETILLKLDDFETSTPYGANEDQVLTEFTEFVNAQEREQLSVSKTGTVEKVCLIAGAICAVIGFFCLISPMAPLGVILLIAGIAACGYGMFAASRARAKQTTIKEEMTKKRRYGAIIIRSFMEEARKWRKVYGDRDAEFETMLADLEAGTVTMSDGVAAIETTSQN